MQTQFEVEKLIIFSNSIFKFKNITFRDVTQLLRTDLLGNARLLGLFCMQYWVISFRYVCL